MRQLFDAVIVLTSFSLDLVFLQGITGPQSEEHIALLIIFLLWRILRIINGMNSAERCQCLSCVCENENLLGNVSSIWATNGNEND